MSPWMRKIRALISWGITIALIILWGPIVAFVGIISNINTLANTVSFLHWINDIPSVVQGIIQGILPPVALAVLFIVLPIFLKACIKLQGVPLESEIERILWARFWVFQVVHGFLIITVASGLPNALRNINQEANQLPTLLANNLPGASIFFLTFVVTTMLATAGKMNARLIPFLMSKLTFLRGNTPRKVCNHRPNPSIV
jgi:calcium permeable stress-gated cation channel